MVSKFVGRQTMINQKKFQFPLKIIQQLLQHAQSSLETEVCGLIGSVAGIAHSCYGINNSHPQPQCKFTLDVTEQIAAFKTLRAKGEQLFAIYHSHPHTAAYPSVTDLALANYPDILYLIISLNTKGLLELRGFNISNHHAKEVQLNLHS